MQSYTDVESDSNSHDMSGHKDHRMAWEEPPATGAYEATDDPFAAQLPVPYLQYASNLEPPAALMGSQRRDDADLWTPTRERQHHGAAQPRGLSRNARPPLERLQEAFTNQSRSDLWDGRWQSEMRPRISVEGVDNYYSHPQWTAGVRDKDRRSVSDILRLVGLMPPRAGVEGPRKSRSPERVVPMAFDTEEAIWTRLDALLHSLARRPNAWPFREPVNPVKANIPDYFDVIKFPMDFGTIGARLLQRRNSERYYCTIHEFLHDMRLVFDNCRLYNSVGISVRSWGDALSESFEGSWAQLDIEGKWETLHNTSSHGQVLNMCGALRFAFGGDGNSNAAAQTRQNLPVQDAAQTMAGIWSEQQQQVSTVLQQQQQQQLRRQSPAVPAQHAEEGTDPTGRSGRGQCSKGQGFRLQWHIRPALWWGIAGHGPLPGDPGQHPRYRHLRDIPSLALHDQAVAVHAAGGGGGGAGNGHREGSPVSASHRLLPAEVPRTESGTDSGAEPVRKRARFKDTRRAPSELSAPSTAAGPDRVSAVKAEEGAAEVLQPRLSNSDASESGNLPMRRPATGPLTSPQRASTEDLGRAVAKNTVGEKVSRFSTGWEQSPPKTVIDFTKQVTEIACELVEVIASLEGAVAGNTAEGIRILQLGREIAAAQVRQQQHRAREEGYRLKSAQLKRAHEQLIQRQAALLGGK